MPYFFPLFVAFVFVLLVILHISFLKGWIILNGIFFGSAANSLVTPIFSIFSAFAFSGLCDLHFEPPAILVVCGTESKQRFQWGLGHTAFRGIPRMHLAGGSAVAGGAGVAEAFRIHPERSQNHPKITQTGPKMTPKTQNGPKVSEITQTDPKMAPKVPKMVRKVPKMVRKVPKMVRYSSQNGQKMTPKWSQNE